LGMSLPETMLKLRTLPQRATPALLDASAPSR
jgi:hypothetical protein